jgi:hypothetical protein
VAIVSLLLGVGASPFPLQTPLSSLAPSSTLLSNLYGSDSARCISAAAAAADGSVAASTADASLFSKDPLVVAKQAVQASVLCLFKFAQYVYIYIYLFIYYYHTPFSLSLSLLLFATLFTDNSWQQNKRHRKTTTPTQRSLPPPSLLLHLLLHLLVPPLLLLLLLSLV